MAEYIDLAAAMMRVPGAIGGTTPIETIAAEWATFELLALQKVPKEVRPMLRDVFYAGATLVADRFVRILSNRDQSPEQRYGQIKQMHREVLVYAQTKSPEPRGPGRTKGRI